MRFFRSFIFILLGLFLFSDVIAQSPADGLTDDQVKYLKSLADSHATKSFFKKAWEDSGTILAPLILLIGVLMTYFGLQARMEKLVDDLLTKKASEKLGVDWDTVKLLVDERKALIAKRAKVKVAIVNQSTGKKSNFHDLLTKAGYPEPRFFTLGATTDNSKEPFVPAFKQSDFHFIIIDNEDGAMLDTDVETQVFDPQSNAFGGKMIWYTKRDLTNFRKFSEKAAILKDWSRILPALDDKL